MLTKFLTGIVLITSAIGSVSAIPIEDTAYGKTPLRLEARPDPLTFSSPEVIAQMEKTVADTGVKTQWLAVVDPNGNPYYASKCLPTVLTDLDKREKQLKETISDMHKRGLSVMSWYPVILSKSSWEKQPEWRQKYMEDPIPGDQQSIWCCINTGYGDALIKFCNEAIDKFDLDGIWFDGSAFTQIWHQPLPYSCICDSCKALFKKQTGYDLPTRANWDDPVFRRWVAWRYDVFGAYIGRLAAGIRKKHPNAAVAINHYHRPMIAWQGGIPLNPFKADIISGSEAKGEHDADLVMRLVRGYGRSQAEVWTSIGLGSDPETSPEKDNLIHHGLTCVTAGGHPAFGGDPWSPGVAGTLKDIAGFLNKLDPYVSQDSVPYAAMLISQQTETFYLSRERKGLAWEMEPFWKSITGWTQGLMQSHIAPDYIYEKQLTAKNLKRYKALFMPMSIAISDAQCATVLRYAKGGGTVILGPWSGTADEWGEKRKTNPLGDALGFRFTNMLSYAATERVAVTLSRPDGSDQGTFPMLHSDFESTDPAWKTVYMAQVNGVSIPGIIERAYGNGKIILSSVDMSENGFKSITTAGGDTSITPTEETAAVGKRSLKFVDGPNAPHSFYPDMEMYFSPITAPAASEGRVSCRIRLEKGADVSIESRDSKPVLGPSLGIGNQGKMWSQGKPLCDVPFGEWFEVEMRFRLTGDDRTFDAYLRRDGAPEQVFRGLPFIQKDFSRCNWNVIFGAGTAPAVFYIDEVKVEVISGGPTPQTMLMFYDGFEDGGDAPTLPASLLADDLLKQLPAPVMVDASPLIRMGAYRRGDSEIIVQLHNIAGSRLKPKDGLSAVVKTSIPVKSARLLFADKQVPVTREGELYAVRVPSVSMQETVILSVE